MTLKAIEARLLRPASRFPPTSGADRPGQRGQVLVVFAIGLTAIIAMAGLLIDGGLAWGNRRLAQAAADTAALAGTKALADPANASLIAIARAAAATTSARTIANANGFATNITNCAGTTVAGGGV